MCYVDLHLYCHGSPPDIRSGHDKGGRISVMEDYTSNSSVQSCSAQSCPTLCDPMNRSTPGLPVHHQLLEFTQTHVHRVSDTIQPSHPLSSPSPPAPNPSQHQWWLNGILIFYCCCNTIPHTVWLKTIFVLQIYCLTILKVRNLKWL